MDDIKLLFMDSNINVEFETVAHLKAYLLALPSPFMGDTEKFTELQPEDVALVPIALRDEINARNAVLKTEHEFLNVLFPFP